MNEPLTPTQKAAIAIIATIVDAKVQFGAQPIICDDRLLGYASKDDVQRLKDAASKSDTPVRFEFDPARTVRGGVTTGLLPTIALVVPNDQNGSTITVNHREIRTAANDDVDYVSIHDPRGEVVVEGDAIDALIESLQALSAIRASNLRRN